jgi:hypothetical protein
MRTTTPGSMNGATSKLFRCAIYTRKSTDHNLDLAFNSLEVHHDLDCHADQSFG